MTISTAGYVPEINTLPTRLRVSREYAGLSMEQLATRAGISRNTVGRAEGGESTPSRATLMVWALACGVDAQWLRTGKAESPSPDGEGLEARHEGFEPPTFCLGVVAGQRAA